MKRKLKISIFLLMTIFSFVMVVSSKVIAAREVYLVVDGNNITKQATPKMVNNRIMVPIRFVEDGLGKKVQWNEAEKSITISDNSKNVRMIIGSRLADMGDGTVNVLDVAPEIIGNRTYVPVRIVANAFGLGADYDSDKRILYINSKQTSAPIETKTLQISGINSNDIIYGKQWLSATYTGNEANRISEIRYLLLDEKNFKGFIIAKGNVVSNPVEYIPSIKENGNRILVASAIDSEGNIVAADAIKVSVKLQPQIALNSFTNGQSLNSDSKIIPSLNFMPKYVNYYIKNNRTGAEINLEQTDPEGGISIADQIGTEGEYSITAIAVDQNGTRYTSNTVSFVVFTKESISLSGIPSKKIIDKAVVLRANRNFDVTLTEYIMRDVSTGRESVLASMPYGTYTFIPGVNDSGQKEFFVRVTKPNKTIVESAKMSATVNGAPRIMLNGVRESAVFTTEEIKLSITGNVQFSNVKYVIKDVNSNETKTFTPNQGNTEYILATKSEKDGDKQVYAVANSGGTELKSEVLSFKIYNGKTFGPKPVVEKDQFIPTVSELARASYEKTTMSAALQTAQAILETGWGQKVPVDKYSGKFSYNLFGIKGKSNNGFVISNTWEEYNGKTFRIDAKFRAYNSINESWDDHKALLLEKERYQIFRDVMYDSTRGAWAIRRAGYATDSKYPIKLMDIIDKYDLNKLDEIRF